MAIVEVQMEGVMLEALLQDNCKNSAIEVRAKGSHLYIERHDSGTQEPWIVARLTRRAREYYEASFRTSSGRWEPLPVAGSIEELANELSAILGPYLQPDLIPSHQSDNHERNSGTQH